MDVSGLVWAGTAVFVVGLIVFDFYAHVRTPHEPTFSESLKWSIFYIAIALVFGVLLGIVWGCMALEHRFVRSEAAKKALRSVV